MSIPRNQFLQICFRDERKLPLKTLEEALYYFVSSPFYDHQSHVFTVSSDEELIEMIKTIPEDPYHSSEHTKKTVYAIRNELSALPQLFVIFQQEYSFSERQFQLIDSFYCLDGSLYCSPDYKTIIQTKLIKMSYYLTKAYEQLFPQLSNKDIETTSSTSLSSSNVMISQDIVHNSTTMEVEETN